MSTEATTVDATNPFANASWNEGAVASATQEAAAQNTVTPKEGAATEEATPGAEPPPSELKEKLGYDDWDTVKADIDAYKKLKETPSSPAEVKYENEESKKLHEAIAKGDRKTVLKILADQDKVDRLSSVELNDNTAADVVKAAMQFKYKDLTENEVEYKFNKQFGIPPKPSQGVDELDDQYAERVLAWEDRVKEVKMELMIEAKTLRPELEQYKQKLVLPDIPSQAPASTPRTQEDLDAEKKMKESFLQSVDETMKSFNGFSVSVKDKDVEIPLTYGLSAEEKTEVTSMVKGFAEKNFDANSLFADRWVKDGKVDTVKMVEDLSSILYREKMSQMYVNDAAAKRLEAYIKEKKKINVNETTTRETFVPDAEKTEMDRVREQAFSS